MAPPREIRYTDALRLNFPLQLVVVIVMGFLSAAGGMWSVSYGLRSDVRDILTRMDAQVKIDIEKARLQDERAATLRDSIDAIKRRQELQQYEISTLKEMILTGKRSKT